MVTAANDYARVLLRNEGRGDEAGRGCPSCASDPKGAPEYRCKTCIGGGLFCRECFLEDHRRRPFCRVEVRLKVVARRGTSLTCIQKWNGRCFEDVSLALLGLRLQLGHAEGETCAAPQAGNVDFSVVHVNGLHAVAVDFCNCKPAASAIPHREQLLQRGLLPATIRDPQTCCTFEVLNQFQLVTLQGKLTGYDYYTSLERMTDNPGTRGLKVCALLHHGPAAR